jgi:hypothetical protein
MATVFLNCHKKLAESLASISRRSIPLNSGLPDGIFTNQNPNLGKFLEGLAMEDVVIFYGHLVYFTAIWYTLYIETWYTYFAVLIKIFPVLVRCAKTNLATMPPIMNAIGDFDTARSELT